MELNVKISAYNILDCTVLELRMGQATSHLKIDIVLVILLMLQPLMKR